MPEPFNPLRDCARKGCPRHCRDGGDARLERISPKPGPFLGLCQDHYGVPPIILKPEAQAIMVEIANRQMIADGVAALSRAHPSEEER
jgi:hypothetical protein